MSTIVKGYSCWRCGIELSEFRLPVSRRDECNSCRAEIHVCKQCDYYDARIANACREERAENIGDKEKANFCDYFKPKKNAFNKTPSEKSEQARLKAEDLFGDAKQKGVDESAQMGEKVDPAQAAREELKRLFGDNN